MNQFLDDESKKNIDFAKIDSVTSLIKVFLDFLSKSKLKENKTFVSLISQNLLKVSVLEKELFNSVFNTKTSVTFTVTGNKSWSDLENEDLSPNSSLFWKIDKKGNFIRFPTIFSLKDKEKYDQLLKVKNPSSDENEEISRLANLYDIQNYCINFEDKILEMIIQLSFRCGHTFVPEKKEYKGDVKELLKKDKFEAIEKDVQKYAEYRKHLNFLDSLFIKDELETTLSDKKKYTETQKVFLDTYWEVVRDKYFWKKVNITDADDALKNFKDFKLEKVLGKENSNNIMNNFIRSFFVFVLKQIRRSAENHLFLIAPRIAKYYKPKGFFDTFDKEVEKGRIFFASPLVMNKNYFNDQEKPLDESKIAKYDKTRSAFKTLYNKMDMRSTFIGQNIASEHNKCFKTQALLKLAVSRKKQAIECQKKKEIKKVLPNKWSKKDLWKLGSKLILTYLPDYSPVHYYLASLNISPSVYAEDIANIFNIKEASFSEDELINLCRLVESDLISQKKLQINVNPEYATNMFNNLKFRLKEFLAVKTPQFKK